MLYRRAPRNPPTLLLRIVAAAGASTVVGMASCGGDIHSMGLVGTGTVPNDFSDDAQVDDGSPLLGTVDSSGIAPYPGDEVFTGSLADANGLVGNPDAEVQGIAPLPEDAGTADALLPEDAGTDAHLVGVIGVVVEPHDSGSTHTCPPLCGVVVGIGPNPGH